MSKKKIAAVVLFLFMSLFMFTFANPSENDTEKKQEDNVVDNEKIDNVDKQEDVNNDLEPEVTINPETNRHDLEIVDNAPTINVDSPTVEIVEGTKYDVYNGVTVNDDRDDDLKVSADVLDTSKLVYGKEYTINYKVTDSSNNTATASRLIIVLNPDDDKDEDGFTNKEEVDYNTDFSKENEYPETVEPVILLKGDNPQVIELNSETYEEPGVEVTLDSHDKITDTEKDLKIELDLDEKVLGEYTVTYSITDRYGKKVSVSRPVRVVDTTAPVISNVKNSSLEKWSNKEVELSWNIDENGSLLDKVQYCYKEDCPKWYGFKKTEFYGFKRTNERNYPVYIRAIDKAGNISDVVKLQLSIDKTKPVFINKNTSHSVSDVVVKAKDNLSGIDYINVYNQEAKKKFTIANGDSLTEEATYRLTAYDKAGNNSTIWLAIDKTSPVINVEDNKIYNSDVKLEIFDKFLHKGSVTINGTDYTKDIKVLDHGEDGKYSTTLTKEGVYKITAIDKVGNESTKTITIDKTKAKTVAANILVLGDDNSNRKFYASNGDTIYAYIRVSEQLKGNPTFNLINNGKSYEIKNVEVSKPNTKGEYTYGIKYLIDESVDMKDGNVSLSVSNIYDLAGNKSNDISKPTNGHIVLIDRAHPVIKVKNGSIGSIEKALFSNVSFKLYDAVSIDKVSLNGVVTDLVNNDYSDLNLITTGRKGAKEGKNTLVLYDLAGNTTEYEFTIDTTNPVIKVKNGSIGNIEKALFSNVSFKLYDAMSIDKVSLNGVITDLVNNDYSDLNLITTGRKGAKEGKNTLVLYDLAGNKTEYEFTIDSVKPYIKYNGVNYLEDTNTLYVNKRFIAEAKDDFSGINKIFTNGHERPRIDVNGEFNFTFKLVDNAGNESIYKVVVDKTSPVIKGVVNNQIYTDKANFEILDKNIDTITIDGVSYTAANYIKEINQKGPHKIVVTDKVGNITTVDFIINETLSLTSISGVTFDGLKVTYDGQFHRVDVKNLPKEFNVSYGRTNGKRDAYNYKVEATITAKEGNYFTGSVVLTTDMIIKPKKVAVNWSNLDLIYDGKNQAPTATVDTGVIANLGAGKRTKDIVELNVSGSQKEIGKNYNATASIENATTNKNNYELENAEVQFNINED